MIRIEYPGKLVSVLNAREHWRTKARRVAAERRTAHLELLCAFGREPKPGLPVDVTVTRIAPRALDTHDNLGASAKAVVDSIAAFFGVADNDPRISFKVEQARGKPMEYGVRIEIEARA